jgi:hypothetical protein
MPFRIEYIQKENWTSWNKFIEYYNPEATIAHNPCLGEVLQTCFGWESRNAVLLHKGEIVALFPYLCISGKLVSMPHFSYGGILCHPDYAKIHDFFFNLVSQEENLRRGQFRKCNFEVRSFNKELTNRKSHKLTSVKSLPSCKEELYEILKPNIKRKIRRAAEHGIEVCMGGKGVTPPELLDKLLSAFYKVYSRNMHYLGSPALSISFFKTLLQNYCNGKARVFVAWKEGKAIAASVSLSYLNTCENIHFSTRRSMNNYYPGYLLHFEMMQQAILDGCTIYSFGRSTRNSGVHKYKQQWEVQDKTIHYNYTREPGFCLTDLSFLSKLWKKLPYPLHKKVGPYIAKKVY